MSHGKITAICQGGLDKLVLNSKVLEAIVKLGIGHVDGKLLKNIFLLRVEVEPHLTKPFKSPGTCDLCTNQLPCHVTLMNMFNNLKRKINNLKCLSANRPIDSYTYRNYGLKKVIFTYVGLHFSNIKFN